MPLGRVDAFGDWIDRDDPSYRVARPIEAWIAELGSRPWAGPSEPVPEMSNQPEYEVRTAVLSGIAAVEVIYRHTYDPGASAGTVDLIW
ncbi:MAG TPA: hypothetical protein VMS00_14820, partial [Acidimicrobiales bacterium]|nr:hypothetical protein [Acidimicrobiales bacterium]